MYVLYVLKYCLSQMSAVSFPFYRLECCFHSVDDLIHITLYIYIYVYIYAYTHITLTTTWNLERNENRTELDSKSCHKHFAQKYIHDFSASTFNDFFIIDLRFFFVFGFLSITFNYHNYGDFFWVSFRIRIRIRLFSFAFGISF